MLKRTLNRWLAVVCLFGAISISQASACGTAMLMPILFKAYPEAKEVYYATRAARAEKLIGGPDWPGVEVMPLHTWRVRMTKLTLMALERRLQRSLIGKSMLQSSHIMLVNEFAWVKVEVQGDQVSFSQGQYPEAGTSRIFTSRRAIDALLTGRISWDDAVKRRLLIIRPASGGSIEDARFLVDALNDSPA